MTLPSDSMTDRPLLRKMIDAIHSLQAKTMTVAEQSDSWCPSWPDCVSSTPRFGTAVTPWQAVYAKHYPLSVGSELVFGGERRVVTRATEVGDDIGVAEWAEPISCRPMRLLPWNWQNWIPTKRDGETLKRPIVAWRCTQDGTVTRHVVPSIGKRAHYLPTDGTVKVRLGDSGGPLFIACREELVLLGCLYSAFDAPSLAYHWKPLSVWAPSATEAVWP